MRADYHPLRLRRTMPSAGHLVDLEAAAAARGVDRPEPGARERFVREMHRLLARTGGSPLEADRRLRLECLGLTKALQWARAGGRILVVPPHGPPGMPAIGTMHVGDIRLPTAAVYVAFLEPVPTPDPDLAVEGVYLGEGGSAEALLAGLAHYVSATAVVVDRGSGLRSAALLLRREIGTADPGILVADAVGTAAEEALAGPTGASSDLAAWTRTFAGTVETALRGAALAAAPLPSRPRRPTGDEEAADETGEEVETAPAVHEIVVLPQGGSGGIAELLFGETPPRLRHRWPASEHGDDVPPSAGVRRGGTGRSPVGFHRRGCLRTYHKGTSREFVGPVKGHDVNGGPGGVPRAVRVDHLHGRANPAPGPR